MSELPSGTDLPRGRLLRRRVLKDKETVLKTALDRELTGYARLEPQDTLLLDGQGVGVLTFVDGVPMAAYETETGSEGSSALTEIASAGPYRLELYELDENVLEHVHENESLLIAPALPAQRLAGDSSLVEQTRENAPSERVATEDEDSSGLDAVETFLDDGEKIESLRERARTEAHSRAEEWGFPTED